MAFASPARKAALALFLLAVPGLSPAAPAAPASTRAAQTRTQLQKLHEKIERVTAGIHADSAQRDRRQNELHAAEQAAVAARAKLHALDQSLQQAEDAAQALQQRQRSAQAALDQARAHLAEELRATYEVGQPSPLMLLLQGVGAARSLRLSAYYDYLARARLAAVEEVQLRAAQVAKLTAEAEAHRKALAQARKAQATQTRELHRREQARAAALADLDAHLTSQKQQLGQLKASAAQLEKLLADLMRALAKTPYQIGNSGPFAKLRGRLPWPLRGPLLARYGQTKADGRLHWQGLWIGAATGTPVRAVAHGRVVYVGWLTRYGLVVVLQHDHGYFTIYGHCALALVHTGDTVHAGQELAEAGNTGGYRRSGVYLEVRHRTQTLDPTDWLAR